MAEQYREAFLRRKEVERLTGLSRSGIYSAVGAKTFPAPVRLGETRSVAWIASEVDRWIEKQIAANRKAAA